MATQDKDNIAFSITTIGFLSTLMSIVGTSLKDLTGDLRNSVSAILAAFLLFAIIAYVAIGQIFKESVSVAIRRTRVSISHGDIFKSNGWIVIPCDTHFDSRVDDVVINKMELSYDLHGSREERGVVDHVVSSTACKILREKTIKRISKWCARRKRVWHDGIILEYRTKVGL